MEARRSLASSSQLKEPLVVPCIYYDSPDLNSSLFLVSGLDYKSKKLYFALYFKPS